jgi:hypothetical protein
MVAQSAIQPPPRWPDTPKPQPTRINAKLTGLGHISAAKREEPIQNFNMGSLTDYRVGF